MKLYSFLISLAFVNVSSYTPSDYIKDLIITNEHVELAFNMNKVAIQDQCILNGLEHVIKKFVEKEDQLKNLNNMFTVPEYIPFYNDMRELWATQKAVRNAIEIELNIPVPKVPKEYIAILEYLRKNDYSPDFIDCRRTVREELGKIRRHFTVKALGNILKRITDGGNPEKVTSLINERSRHDTDDFENRMCRALETSRPVTEISFECTCRFIALFMGAKFPESNIREMEVNPDDNKFILRNYYILEDIPSNVVPTTQIFQNIEGQWCQVVGDVVLPLKELLK